MTTVLNFFGGPGSGKSTMAAAVFAELKCEGITCELVQEYAKDKVWENSYFTLENQIYVFGKQLHRMYRIFGKVDVIITDSPLLMSIHYGTKETYIFKALVLEQHHKVPNLNIFLERGHKYEQVGRIQNEEEAKVMDRQMKEMLISNHIEHINLPANRESIPEIIELVKSKL